MKNKEETFTIKCEKCGNKVNFSVEPQLLSCGSCGTITPFSEKFGEEAKKLQEKLDSH